MSIEDPQNQAEREIREGTLAGQIDKTQSYLISIERDLKVLPVGMKAELLSTFNKLNSDLERILPTQR